MNAEQMIEIERRIQTCDPFATNNELRILYRKLSDMQRYFELSNDRIVSCWLRVKLESIESIMHARKMVVTE